MSFKEIIKEILPFAMAVGWVFATIYLYRSAGRIVLVAFRTECMYVAANYYRRNDHPLIFWGMVVFWLTSLAVMTSSAILLVLAVGNGFLSYFK